MRTSCLAIAVICLILPCFACKAEEPAKSLSFEVFCESDEVFRVDTKDGLIGIHRADFSTSGITVVTLRIYAVLDGQATRAGEVNLKMLDGVSKGSIYLGIPASTVPKLSGKVHGFCVLASSDVCEKGQFQTEALKHAYEYVSTASAHDTIAGLDEESVIWAFYWSKESDREPMALNEYLAKPAVYDSWEKDRIIADAKRNQDSLTIFATIEGSLTPAP